MILAFDSYYYENCAKTVCLAFENWDDAEYTNAVSEVLEHTEDYVPGAFYKRELPCILSLINAVGLDGVTHIVIDGYVYLDDENKFGLGAYLYERLNSEIPVIGVAKTNFHTIEKNKKLLYRGESKNPLYITSIGIAPDAALNNIQLMHGKYRIPALLKELDRLTKEK